MGLKLNKIYYIESLDEIFLVKSVNKNEIDLQTRIDFEFDGFLYSDDVIEIGEL